MTPQEIAADLRNAARIVAENDYIPWLTMYWDSKCGSCMAIKSDSAEVAFNDAMDDEIGRGKIFWWPRDEAHRHVRVMALLFAAEFVERP